MKFWRLLKQLSWIFSTASVSRGLAIRWVNFPFPAVGMIDAFKEALAIRRKIPAIGTLVSKDCWVPHWDLWFIDGKGWRKEFYRNQPVLYKTELVISSNKLAFLYTSKVIADNCLQSGTCLRSSKWLIQKNDRQTLKYHCSTLLRFSTQ